MDDFFDKSDHWFDKPEALEMQDTSLEQNHFLAVIDECLSKLPKKLKAIFMLRDVHELEYKNICKELDISATNAWVNVI